MNWTPAKVRVNSAGQVQLRFNPRDVKVTDRALRYRANADPPEGPKQCAFCGANRGIEVGHVNGHEEDCSPENLIWTCRSCNVRCANTMRRAGIGRLTHQYNPKGGATSLGEWLQAVEAIKGGDSGMSVSSAVKVIRATSHAKRSEFAHEIWGKRYKHYGSTGRSDSVPF